ncbi:MAG: 30S ribosomal protein S2 [Planctomycetes bacterium]|nr:30S ribosomal protein S2 [Planctomycetota bacterium]
MTADLVQQLIDSGIHFGHKASRWNPKMKPYILSKHNTVHLINIRETVRGLLRAKKFITDTVRNNKDVLFVGTKRQAKSSIQAHAERVGMPYVAERWLGGTLTNFRTIRARLARLEELEQLEESGQLYKESKKAIARLTRERKKILRNLSGIRNMSELPGAVVIIDAKHEHNAVLECKKLGVPSICLIDTDSDPDLVDLPIPGNDDAIRAIELIISELADAAAAGKLGRSGDSDRKGSSTGAPGQKRSRRPTTSQLASEQNEQTESAGEPAKAAESTEAASSGGADAPAVVAVGETASSADHATESPT